MDVEKSYISAVDTAIALATEDEPRAISDELIQVSGMSSRKGRMFFNHLFHLLGKTNYLEIGTWMGSMFCAALYKNPHVCGIAIDNFSQFQKSPGQPHDVRQQLDKNLRRFAPGGIFYDADCWAFDKTCLPLIDVYFFDGDHTEDSQYRAFVEYDGALADTFIAIVDDWEFPPHYYDVRLGTLRAFKDLGYQVVRSWVLPKAEQWHEGMFVAVIKKRRAK